MISHYMTEKLTSRLAHEVICSCCKKEAVNRIVSKVSGQIKKEAEAEEKKRPHAEFFEVLFKSLASHERRFRLALKKHWEEEERIVVANLKKLKKEWLKKNEEDIAESILFPKVKLAEKLTESAKKIAIVAMTDKGQQELDRLGIDASFDITSEWIEEWLKTYFPKFSEEFEAATIKELKIELIEGIKAGESIIDLTARVRSVFEGWEKTRAYTVARDQVLRASNKGSLNAMKQSGVVKKRIWITFFDDRTCIFCEEMDGKVMDIEENFFNEGDEFTIERDDKSMTMNLDYEDIDCGHLHCSCRCTIGAIFEEE